MRTVYLGTSDFAVAVLYRLAGSDHAPSLVITRPDRPAGRGRKLQSPPVADAARALGIPVFQPAQLADEEATAVVLAEKADALIVCAYGAIVREPLLSALPIYNVHPSLLPRWRGAAPIERAIAAGDAETGVSIMHLEAGLDSGPVALQESIAIEPGDTYGTLAERLAKLSGDLLLRALDAHPPVWTPQPEEGVTYAEKITAEDRTLDPAATAEVNERLVRALSPHIGTRVALPDGSMLGVHAARLLPTGDGPETDADDTPSTTEAPTIPVTDDHTLHIDDASVRLGALELTRVQPAGGKAMDAGSWLRGRGGKR
ncbi:MAG: methionyl-tRNA formyltransferase [Solirubrobacteraceae bacterium]|nr:methionyl-tRNA formyltransferase [Solirubrobacteraceae bacterium]